MAKHSPRTNPKKTPLRLEQVEAVLTEARHFVQEQESLAMALGRWENGFIREPGPYVSGDGGYLSSRIAGAGLVAVSSKIIKLQALGYQVIQSPDLLGVMGAYAANMLRQEAAALKRIEQLGERMPSIPTVDELRTDLLAMTQQIRTATNPVVISVNDQSVRRALQENLSTFRQPTFPSVVGDRGVFVLMPGNVPIHRTSMSIDSDGRAALQDFALDTRDRIASAASPYGEEIRGDLRKEGEVVILGALVSPAVTGKVQSVQTVVGSRFGQGSLRAMKFQTLPLDTSMLGRRVSSLVTPALSQRMNMAAAKSWEPLTESPEHITESLYVDDLRSWVDTRYGSRDALFELYAQGAFQDTLTAREQPYER